MATQGTDKAAAPARKSTAPGKKVVSVRGATQASRLHDYEGARQLLSRYCALIDQGKLVALSELFHPQAIFSVSFDSAPKHVGRAAILAWYADFFRPRRGQFRYPRHKLFEPYLVLAGNTATATSYFDSDFVEASGAVRILAGRYDDVLVKERGRWLFNARTITVCYHYSPGTAREGMQQ
ncbi:MAG: nuclear transport factor 2 family protein [Gammaproteobacteria bacterium]|nr:nuclear transport factor 2 family protein [Gammaproteobacteria bacterium]